jgi:putative flippase GtrA
MTDDGRRHGLSTLAREYVLFCLVGTFNLAVFFLMYLASYSLLDGVHYRAATSWSVSYLLSSILSHSMHRWFTFKSLSPYGKSLVTTMAVYSIMLVVSTASQAHLADNMGYNHILVWALNTLAFGLASFIALRFIAFPASDGSISVRERMQNSRIGRRS